MFRNYLAFKNRIVLVLVPLEYKGQEDVGRLPKEVDKSYEKERTRSLDLILQPC
jgi:hypothetical protein